MAFKKQLGEQRNLPRTVAADYVPPVALRPLVWSMHMQQAMQCGVVLTVEHAIRLFPHWGIIIWSTSIYTRTM